MVRNWYGDPGLGVSLRWSEVYRQRAEDKLAQERRIVEAELQQKAASGEASELQSRVVSWIPRVALGLGVAVVAVVVVRQLLKRRKGGT